MQNPIADANGVDADEVHGVRGPVGNRDLARIVERGLASSQEVIGDGLGHGNAGRARVDKHPLGQRTQRASTQTERPPSLS
jgi:hypothetical protein